MTTEEKRTHHKTAVDCFNAVWELLDKDGRTAEEDLEMIHAAHCSRYHWGQIGTDLEFQRGEWQISRVYSVLGMGESALVHAEAAYRTCVENEIGDFDMAFALEALARAHLVSGNGKESQKYRSMALEASRKIEDEDNREYFLSELSSIE